MKRNVAPVARDVEKQRKRKGREHQGKSARPSSPIQKADCDRTQENRCKGDTYPETTQHAYCEKDNRYRKKRDPIPIDRSLYWSSHQQRRGLNHSHDSHRGRHLFCEEVSSLKARTSEPPPHTCSVRRIDLVSIPTHFGRSTRIFSHLFREFGNGPSLNGLQHVITQKAHVIVT